jgi:ribosomal protein S27E
VSAVDRERFGLGTGRPRPPFTARTVKCSGCGASQSLKNEHSQLVVCEYCGSHLEVSGEELKILGKGPDQQWQFPLALGDSFRFKGARFEIIARLALIEDGDRNELTRQYLLFHPRRGSMWLSEYLGHYDLSTTTHVMPVEGPFAKKKGDLVRTHDQREWLAVENGMYQVAYVDGALPWVARIGDLVAYAEFTSKDGSGALYEVEAHGDEIEYGRGERLTVAQVRSATGKHDLPEPSFELEDVVARIKDYRWLLAVAAVALVINGLLWLVSLGMGRTVLKQRLSAAALTGESLSDPFTVAKDGGVVKVDLSCPSLDNAWMAVDLAFVTADDMVVHATDEDIEYYHGVEGGESWSEGSRSTSVYVKLPKRGHYRLLLHAVGASGESVEAQSCQHDIRVVVTDGAVRPLFFMMTAILSLVVLIGVGARYASWRKGDEDDDEEDD